MAIYSALLQDPKPPLLTSEWLMEINMGSFENQPWSQCRWVIDPRVGARATPFPGPGGESLEDVLSRASNMVDFLLQSDFATVLIVSHGMFLKEFLHALCIRAGGDKMLNGV
ncbi:hypothetical protein VTP01DRAFT_197 [Rhizomucor pusillus]|uniref:uncharacterized protein n=1 Tax=Rhizomucor pusillus TaxID=4840 RepID=UPI0037430707